MTVIAGLLALVLGSARAQSIEIHIDDQLAGQAGIDAASAEADLGDVAGGDLRLGDQREFLHQMAQAAIAATKGMGADYASNPQHLVAGFSLGPAVNSASFTLTRDPERLPDGGFAFQAMGMAGANLGALAGKRSVLRRVVLYVNGMAMQNAREPFAARLYNYGAHVQVQLVRPPSLGVVEWGGLTLTSGWESSSYALTLSREIPLSADPVTWEATGTYDVTASAASVPVELSTNLRVLFAAVYAGAAVDFNIDGAAESTIALDGPLTVDSGGSAVEVGTARVSWSGRAPADDMVPRLFGGVQVEALLVKVYGHVNVGLDRSVGMHVGARVAF